MNKGWCLIPPSIFNNSDLSDSEKLLFGKLLGLTNKTGYCWASNRYLADMFDVSERSIQRRIGSLEKKGFIELEQNGRRYIRIRIEGDKSVVDGVTELSSDSIQLDFKKKNSENRLFEDMLCKSVHTFWGEMRMARLVEHGLMKRKTIPPLTTARRNAILKAHKDGYTEDDMRTAIEVVLNNDYHLENGYTYLTLILRDTKIEQYLSWDMRDKMKDEKTMSLEPKELYI